MDVESGRPRWHWDNRGGTQLFDAHGTEFFRVDRLTRVEVERLLTLQEIDGVLTQCGGGVDSWVRPSDARSLWLDVEPWLDDVEDWRPPPSAPGARPYRAELWRAENGHHAMVFINE